MTDEQREWHHPKCAGECMACLIERIVREHYGQQVLDYLLSFIHAAEQRTAAKPEMGNLYYELEGVVQDVENGKGFDAVCLQTIKRVQAALGQEEVAVSAAPAPLTDAEIDRICDRLVYFAQADCQLNSSKIAWAKSVSALCTLAKRANALEAEIGRIEKLTRAEVALCQTVRARGK